MLLRSVALASLASCARGASLIRVQAVLSVGFVPLVRSMAGCAATDIPTIKLNDGHKHPAIGYGTYKVGVVPASASSAVASGSTATEAVSHSSAL